MKKMLLIFSMIFAVVGCSATKEVVEVFQGPPGLNGHSLVSVYQAASSVECDEQGGSRLDIYMDTDDSLTVSEGDLYENSIIACNGLNGLNGQNGLDGTQGAQGVPGEQGPQGIQGAVGPQGIQGIPGPVGPAGPQGPQGVQGPAGSSGATITSYASTGSCVSIVGTSYYTKSGDIYDNSTCSSSHKVAVLQGSGDTFWIGTNKLATDNNGSGIRVITFN